MHSCHIEDTLKSHGLRTTKDRHDLLCLFEEPRALSASQIHLLLKKRMDLSTIYRNLQTLLEEELLVPLHAHGKEQLYELPREHHDHAVCEECDQVTCVPCPVPGFKKHALEFFTHCKTCA